MKLGGAQVPRGTPLAMPRLAPCTNTCTNKNNSRMPHAILNKFHFLDQHYGTTHTTNNIKKIFCPTFWPLTIAEAEIKPTA